MKALLVLLLVAGSVQAQTTTFKDAQGRPVGKAVTRNNETKFYDPAGRYQGKSVARENQSGERTIKQYAPNGRYLGKVEEK